MQLQNNHPFLSASQDMIELSKPIKKFGITYFSYSRHYNTGDRFWLTTHADLLENYYKKKYYLSGNTESHPEKYAEQTVLWSTLPNQTVFEDARNFNVGNGIFIIQPKSDYCEFYGFGGENHNEKIINVFLTHLDSLNNFILDFNDKGNFLIHQTEQTKISFPYHEGPSNFLTLNKLIIDGNTLYLTKRQKQCAYLLLQGKTAREMGEIMHLSSRTIETYINNLKIKLQCHNKAALIAKLIKRIIK